MTAEKRAPDLLPVSDATSHRGNAHATDAHATDAQGDGAHGVALEEIVRTLDSELSVDAITDYPGAVNGLQFGNRGTVHRVATAVDASLGAIREAAAAGADLLIVHHGLFWSGVQPVTGLVYEKYRILLERNIALYSAHLPLDLHAEYGNNIRLARSLGLVPSGGFAHYGDTPIGLKGTSTIPTDDLVSRVREFAAQYGGSVRTSVPTTNRTTLKWAMCTGGGASSETISEALAGGVDTLIVGEGPHHTTVSAIEHDLCIVFAGHYATETLGVQALGQFLHARYALPWIFLRLPTGS